MEEIIGFVLDNLFFVIVAIAILRTVQKAKKQKQGNHVFGKTALQSVFEEIKQASSESISLDERGTRPQGHRSSASHSTYSRNVNATEIQIQPGFKILFVLVVAALLVLALKDFFG